MILRKYKMLIEAVPFPIEWTTVVTKGPDVAFKKAKGEIKIHFPSLKTGKLIECEKISEREV